MARESPAVRVTHASPGICPSTDILLAASEACANVVLHAGQSVHAYEVAATVAAAGCRVEVTDDEMFAPGPAAARDRPSRDAGSR
ncbi:MAG TPA: ATP-binding protein [Actinospica sp.]|nr:ATP-binding protein [Actinospica sp.]